MIKSQLVLALCVGLLIAPAAAETVRISAAADTSLFQLDPGFNFGAQSDLPVGTLGTFADASRSRGLFRFDVASVLPPDARVESARLILTVTRAPDGRVNSTFTLHRMLRHWGEGAQRGETPGGKPAVTGESNWNFRFVPDQPWGQAGGQPDVDFADAPSASASVLGLGAYEFSIAADHLADLEDWTRNPDSNFGWMLLTDSEETPKTARRFASREHPSSPPILEVTFSTSGPPPESPVITGFGIEQGRFVVEFTTQPGLSYSLETTPSLSDVVWAEAAVLEAADPSGTATLSAPFAALQNGYFRLKTE